MNNIDYSNFVGIPAKGVRVLRVVNMSPHLITQNGDLPGVILVRTPERYVSRRLFWRPWILVLEGSRGSGGSTSSSVISGSTVGGSIIQVSNVGSITISDDEIDSSSSSTRIIVPRDMNISIESLTS